MNLQKIRVVVTGAAGQMGRTVVGAVSTADDMELVGVVDPRFASAVAHPEATGANGAVSSFEALENALDAVEADVVVDFSLAEGARHNIAVALERGVSPVVGTTGLTREDLERFRAEAEARRVPAFVAPNFALGAVLMMVLSQQAARYFPDAEIIEMHHENKKDAPSGTAKRTADLIAEVWREAGVKGADAPADAAQAANAIPTHSVRLPGIVADQQVIFGALGQTLTIEHRTTSRESFMPGVLLAVRKVRSLQGLVVGLENIL